MNPLDEETVGNYKQGKTQDERRHRMAGLAVDSILKTCAMRRSCDNITSVVISFDNFYRRLDECKRFYRSGSAFTSNDHEVFEEIHISPVNDAVQETPVIYIESDDHIESVTESQNFDVVDEAVKALNENRLL